MKICKHCGETDESKMHKAFYKSKNSYVIFNKCEKCFIEQSRLASLGKRFTHKEKEAINKKRVATNIKEHGYDHPMHSERIIKERNESFIEMYGVDNPWKAKEVIEKMQKNNLEKYNNVCSLHGELQKKKKIKTWQNNYGQDIINPMQVKDIINKANETKLHNNSFAFMIGTQYHVHQCGLKYQGSYEKDFLDKYYERVCIEKGPTIKYLYNNETHLYFPDFFIKDLNLIIEIKSAYTQEIWKDKITAKEIACINQNFNYIMILDKDYNDFEKLLSQGF